MAGKVEYGVRPPPMLSKRRAPHPARLLQGEKEGASIFVPWDGAEPWETFCKVTEKACHNLRQKSKKAKLWWEIRWAEETPRTGPYAGQRGVRCFLQKRKANG